MRYSRSLQFRLTIAFLAFVILTSSMFATGIYIANDYMEESVLDDTLQQEADEFIRDYMPDHRATLPYSTTLHSYLVPISEVGTLPPELRQLKPGIYHDLPIKGEVSHILIKLVENQRLYLIYNTSQIEERESILLELLVSGVLLASLAAVWWGFLLSRRAILPVTALANRVTHLRPSEQGTSLSQEFEGYEVGLIAQAFDQFLHRQNEFTDRERAFTEDASHELRTPLAVIASASELLMGDSTTPEHQRPVLARINRASVQMRRLIHALLYLARESGFSADDEDFCRVDLLVKEVVEINRHMSADKSLDLEVGVLEYCEVKASADLIVIVMTNLLRNAIQYTERGGVTLSLIGNILTVSDTGIGIPADRQKMIFERHYRGDRSRGAGIGLYLVKCICDRHGWLIDVSSGVDAGSHFKVTFLPTSAEHSE